MIQFNLLPDVKQQYIKARRTKRLVFLVAIAASAASLVIFAVTFTTVDVVQKKSMRDLSADITSYGNKLQGTSNLDKILTVQNQLNTLTSLHDQKVVASRLFGYASKVTPSSVTISNLNVDYTANTMVITGEAPTLDLVNTYADTLKATNYTFGGDSTSKPAFSNVVLANFGRDSKGATYTMNLSFDPLIFNGQNQVNLNVPAGTQSNTTTLFEKQVGK